MQIFRSRESGRGNETDPHIFRLGAKVVVSLTVHSHVPSDVPVLSEGDASVSLVGWGSESKVGAVASDEREILCLE